MKISLIVTLLTLSFSVLARDVSVYTNSQHGETIFFGTYVDSYNGVSKIDFSATLLKEAAAIQVEAEHFYATGELTTSLEQRVSNLQSNVDEFESASTEECVDELSLMAKSILSQN